MLYWRKLISKYVPSVRTRNTQTFYCESVRTNLYLNLPLYAICVNYNEISGHCDINIDPLSHMNDRAIFGPVDWILIFILDYYLELSFIIYLVCIWLSIYYLLHI